MEGILKIQWVDKTWVCGWGFRDWGCQGWVGVGGGYGVDTGRGLI